MSEALRTDAHDERSIDVFNPYDNSLIGSVPKRSVADLRAAIASAKSYDFALTAWQRYEIQSVRTSIEFRL